MKKEFKPKISLIGAGQIGGTLAHLCLQRKLGHVVLFDINAGMAKGKALDLAQSCAADDIDASVIGTDDPAELENSDAVIITAGLPRKPGMSRDDLIETNSKIMHHMAQHVKTYCPNAFVVVVTNPLDAMVSVFQKYSGLPHQKVVGMAGVLDTSRYRSFLAEALGVSVSVIRSFVLGGHGDSMVPLRRFTTVTGIALEDYVKRYAPSVDINAIDDRTRNGGAEIVNLLQTGSAFYTPASSALQMAESYLYDLKKILPCAVYLNGEYGVNDLYVGVPALIGSNGVEQVVELTLTEQETSLFQSSVESVRQLMKNLG